MLNPEKVELMTRIKVAEQGRNQGALLNKSYFEGKSTRRIVTSLLFGTASYALILILAYLLFGRYLIDFTQKTALSVILVVIAAVVGIAFVFAYVKVIKVILQKRYRDSRSSLVRYDLSKRKLAKLKEKKQQ